MNIISHILITSSAVGLSDTRPNTFNIFSADASASSSASLILIFGFFSKSNLSVISTTFDILIPPKKIEQANTIANLLFIIPTN